jgi:hypothetical protein
MKKKFEKKHVNFVSIYTFQILLQIFFLVFYT